MPKRGKVFTKLIKELMVAARMGGGNPRSQSAAPGRRSGRAGREHAQGQHRQAIKKGTGDLDGVNYEEFMYEGYGPSGVAVLVDIMTDNRNRAAAEIRHNLQPQRRKPG